MLQNAMLGDSFMDESFQNTVYLDKNENPYDVAPSLKEELRMRLQDLSFNRYPDVENRRLREALALEAGLDVENVTVGNGGDEIIQMLFLAFTKPGSTVMTLSPCFSQYCHLCKVFPVEQKAVSFKLSQGQVLFDEEKFLDCLSSYSPDLILLDRPNNPTGKSLSLNFVKRVIELSRGVVLVDEAYAEFDTGSILDFYGAKNFPENLVVLRTFSKAWGMAGLRIGYGFTSYGLRKSLERVRPPFNLNIISAEAALIALKYKEWMLNRVEGIKCTRDRFISNVNKLRGWKAYPSSANFVLVESQCNRGALREALRINGLNVKFLNSSMFSSLTDEKGDNKVWFRVTIGQEEDMGRLINIFKSLS